MKMEIRTAEKGDLEAIFEAMVAAFHLEKGSRKWKSVERMVFSDPEFSLAEFLILYVNGDIVSTLRIEKNVTQIGRCTIMKGDVGWVCTFPQHQGKGYGSRLMTDSVKYMKEKGYDISRLGGRVEFYSRFGWEPFPRRHVEFSIEKVGSESELCGEFRPFEPERDFVEYLRLHQEFNRDYPGALVVTSEHKKVFSPHELSFVFEHRGNMEGYAILREQEASTLFKKGGILIDDIGFRKDSPAVLELLIDRTIEIASGMDKEVVYARIPWDYKILEQLRNRFRFRLVELHSCFGSNMIRVVNLKSLIGKMLPELESRLRGSISEGWKGVLAIDVGDENVQVSIEQGKMSLVEGRTPIVKLSLNHATLMKLVLGLYSPGEMGLLDGLKPADSALLEDLFPRQPTASGNWC